MPVYKDKNNTWHISFYYTNYQGERKRNHKRGFKTKKEALEYQTEFLLKSTFSSTMTFQSLYELYIEDMSYRLRLNTIEHKKHIILTKILPFFKKMTLDSITPIIVRKWQNQIMSLKNKKGELFSQTYIKNINTQLSAIFNYAVKYHNLRDNPCHRAGSMGKKHADEMEIWTIEEFNKFIELLKDMPITYTGFQILFWTGIRIGELLALTLEDIDFNKKTLRINKSYQRLKKQDIITDPKTPKSKRTISITENLLTLFEKYIKMLYKPTKTTRLFNCTKSIFEHTIKIYSSKSGVKKIRVHDLRHSHASFLLNNNVNILAISQRLGHENIETTLKIYAHLYESSNELMMSILESESGTILVPKK